MIDPRSPNYRSTPIAADRPRYHYAPVDPGTPPAVSIITPFYNTGPVFAETAQSVMLQSLQQWEWIIVNDGTNDPAALRMLANYRGNDPRVRVIDHPQNLGLPAARNTGARAARSGYLLFLDSDDLLEPTAAEKWLWFLDGRPDLAFASGYSVGFGAHEYLWQSGFQDMQANLEENRINHLVLERKSAWEAVGGYDETMRSGLEDWDFWVRAADKGLWGQSVPEYLHWYRTRADHTDRWKALTANHKEALREGFRQRFPRLYGDGFPQVDCPVSLELLEMREDAACANRLRKDHPRLLMVAPWLVTGGAEKFNLDLIQQLTQRGWEVTVATTAASANPWLPTFTRLTPDVFPMRNFLEWSDYPRFLAYLVESRQVDALLVTGSHEGYRLLPYLRERFPGLPILDYLHFVTPEWMDGGFPRLSLLFHEALDLSLTTSQQLKDWMVTGGADGERVQVCTINVDTQLWKPDAHMRLEARARLDIPDDLPLILYVGRLEPQKQPEVFASTMLRLHEEGLAFTALVIGGGSLKAWLEGFVEAQGLQEQVRFAGEVPSEQVRGWMAAGDILFLPSQNEGIAVTFFEAMASGLAPVGADVGGQRELVTPECGILLPRGDPEEEAARYAGALTGLIRDPELRRRMGQASRERVTAYFDLQQMGERMVALIELAQRLRADCPHELDRAAITRLLARQGAEYARVMEHYRYKERDIAPLAEALQRESDQVARLQRALEELPMPPASAGTYFYFGLRRIFYPLFRPLTTSRWFERLKNAVKARFTRADR